MKDKKYIFFDIDGTLTDENPGGKVLPSTYRTLDKLRANGHFVALATGRANFYAEPFAKEHGFENMISDGGNGITLHNELLGIEPLDKELCLEIIDECLKKGIAFGVSLSDEPKFYTSGNKPFSSNLSKDIIKMDNFKDVEAIYKVYVRATREQEKDLVAIHKLEYMRYEEKDLIVEPLEKYRGIVKLVEHIGGDTKDIVVFGDGKNDISMMKQAPLSIAMGNAIEEVKAVASYVTKSNKEDGIEYACKHFGWID